jgi:hypothetical protein
MNGAGGGEGVRIGARQGLAVAQLDGIDRPARQGGQEGVELVGELLRNAEILRRELEEERAAFISQPFDVRRHDVVHGIGHIEEQGVDLTLVGAVARTVRPARDGEHLLRLDQETEAVRHGRRVLGEFPRLQRLVVGAVEPDAPQQRMPRIGRQTFLGQPRLGVLAAPDQPHPAGERPGRAAEADLRGQLPAELTDLFRNLRRLHPLLPRLFRHETREQGELVRSVSGAHASYLTGKRDRAGAADRAPVPGTARPPQGTEATATEDESRF